MTAQSLHTLESSLQAMPVAMFFSKQLLLPQKSSAAFEARSPDGLKESLTIRATKLTAVLKDIPGYSHGGLND